MALRVMQIDSKSVGHGVHLKGSSIFSGGLLTIGFAALFLLFGSAVDLSFSNVIDPTVPSLLRFFSWLYTAITMIAAYFFASMMATRSDDIVSNLSGILHGVVSWGLATAFGVFLTTFTSPTARAIFEGNGPVSGTWLALCIVGFGLPAAIVGGQMTKQSVASYAEEEKTKAAS